ncbi:hypothetical protein H1P_50024 [Hyella patelloides LEGE 07179]|uniref:Uncharacterized protein n=1 Tax=Hyella patelloides LEGE 07179 TaxID=945734 RepID=A0A563VZG6_9CYAN|nr:hypothetical protein H1P_50024 [Hyella patelloides LEGE 07179]
MRAGLPMRAVNNLGQPQSKELDMASITDIASALGLGFAVARPSVSP